METFVNVNQWQEQAQGKGVMYSRYRYGRSGN